MKYFNLDELCASNYATANQIPNNPTSDVVDNLRRLVDFVLDPLRQAYGQPIYINSGFRSVRLNEAVKGSKTSQHVLGEAADLDTRRGREENKKIFEIIKTTLPFDQLINEHDYEWIHVSFSYGKNRNQILTIK